MHSVSEHECWLPIPGYEGLYEASNFGRVRSLYRSRTNGKILSPGICGTGYQCLNLCKNGVHRMQLVHRLVAKTFIPNPDSKPQVNHKDGNKKNNKVSNLEWATRSENMLHALDVGLNPMVKNNKSHSKAVDMYSLDGKMLLSFPSAAEARRQTGIDAAHIRSCCKGKQKTSGGFMWKYHSGGDTDALQNE